MSEPGARGRSFHGNNYAEQWERAIQEDPRVVFITGWNEWFAGRFDEFIGIKTPPMFVDEFDEEHSRDIEPMKGGHGDNYYWQTVNFIRRYKGAPPLPPAVTPQAIVIDGKFDDWKSVRPEYSDTVGDPVHRHHARLGQSRPLHQQHRPQRHCFGQGQLRRPTCLFLRADQGPADAADRPELDAAA